jgi:hypothetical protein
MADINDEGLVKVTLGQVQDLAMGCMETHQGHDPCTACGGKFPCQMLQLAAGFLSAERIIAFRRRAVGDFIEAVNRAVINAITELEQSLNVEVIQEELNNER